MSYIDIKYLGGIDDKEVGANLTGSATLLKSSKDILGGNKIIIDFGMFQGCKNADLLNSRVFKELLDADFLVVTHAHMDHIGLVPLLVKAGFKGKIIMTSITKDLAILQWKSNIDLIQGQRRDLTEGNKKKGQKLREYLKIVNSNDNSKNISEELLNEAKEYLYIADIHNDNIAHIFSKKQAESLLSIYNRIKKLEKLKEDKKQRDKKDFSQILTETISLLNSDNYDNDKLDKNLFSLSLYPVEFSEYRNKTEDKNVLKILDLVEENYTIAKRSKLLSKSEQEELNELNIKLKKIIGNKDLELCLIYANKIFEKNSIDSCLNQNIPELLYDIDDVYKTLEQIETLEYGEERSLDSRIVITRKDSEVIEKLPEIIEDGYNKKIYVLPQLKQYVIDFFKGEYEKTIGENKKNKKMKEEYEKAKRIIREYNKKRNKLIVPKNELNEELNKKENIENYYNKYLGILENNPIYLARKDLKKVLEYKKKIASQQRIFGEIETVNLEDNNNEIKQVENDISSLENKNFGNFNVLELLEFYNKNINSYINRKTGNSKKEKLDSFYGDFNFFIKNKEIIELLFGEDKKNLEEILKIEEKIKVLQEKKLKLEKIEEKIKARDKFLEKKEEFLREIKEVEEKYNIEINSGEDIENYIKENFGKKPLKYTKKQIEKVILKLEPILEKENEKIVESLKLRFYKAGHIEGSAMASISYITKEIKNKVNGLLRRQNTFDGHKEIKKSHKNLLFSGDLGKITDPNLSGSPDIPNLKYDYVQLESTYANKNHPDKKKEFERLIEILKRPGPKLGATFAINRSQEFPVESLNLFDKNLDNHKKLENLYNKRKKINSEYNKIKNSDDKDKIAQKFLELSSINTQIEEINKNYYSGVTYLDSLLGSKVTEEFIKSVPEVYKILDPMVQKQKFGEEKFRILGDGNIDKLYEKHRNFLVFSNSGMFQGGRIIEHLKRIVSKSNGTILLFGYVAEGTLGRQLLNGAKTITIDGKLYDVKCKVESIGGYSSHMGQDDLVQFGGKLLNYSKNAKLALNHGDENRNILKGLIGYVNNKVDILVPKLGDKIRINL